MEHISHIERAFREYHREHPEVFRELTRLAFQWKATGRHRVGIATLVERCRWHFTVDTTDRDGFKMNNNYNAHYARLLMETYPELDGMFQLRELRA